MSSSVFDPGDFHIPDGCAHLSVAGESPYLERHALAHERFVADKSGGQAGRQKMEREVERVRELVAGRFSVPSGELAFLSNVAEAADAIAAALVVRAAPGNFCIFKQEFPSLALPFVRWAEASGHHVRWLADEGDLDAAADSDTIAVVTSHVCFRTGRRIAIERLREICDRHSARLIIDYSQSAGYLPSDWSLHDVGMSAVYKWLLGEPGVALLHVNGERCSDLEPRSAGWRSISPVHSESGTYSDVAMRPCARRFERGNLAYQAVYILGSAMEYLGMFDASGIWTHVRGLADRVVEEAVRLSLPLLTPARSESRGASICIGTRGWAEVARVFEDAGLLVWGGAGRIRISFHAYNSPADAERVTSILGNCKWT